MKKLLFICVSASFLAVSCSKSGGEGDNTTVETYLNSKTNSTWNYEDTDNQNPTAPPTQIFITSTNRDTTVGSKTYHIYSDNVGGSIYQGKFSNDYSAFEALPTDLGGALIDNIYLKADAAINSSWLQSYNIDAMGFPITVKVTNKIIEKAINKSVLSNNYTNVIHVKTDIALSGAAAAFVTVATDIHSYYAPNYGLIQQDAKIEYTITGSPTDTSNTTRKLKAAVLL